MSERRLSYVNRNFNDYKESILDITRKYYPDVFGDLNDASIGMWLIDILADMGDNLNYHLDRVIQETNIDSASQPGSVKDIARTNGLKIPYKTAALVEVALTCTLPLSDRSDYSTGQMYADENYCPIVRRGTRFSNGSQTFELVGDLDFKEQFDENGYSNRVINPVRDSNGNIVAYEYTKLGVATACQTRIYKKVINNADLTPFMSIEVTDENILDVESIIVKEGVSQPKNPELNEFYVDKEEYFDGQGVVTKRFFEVDNLIEQYRYGYEVEETTDGRPIGEDVDDDNVRHENYYNPVWEISEKIDVETEDGSTESIPLKLVAKGQWKRLKQKFITERDNEGRFKVIFGNGLKNEYGKIPTNAREFTQYQMSRMTANDLMGVLPDGNSTMYILYRTGGGEDTNIAAETLNYIINLNLDIDGNCEDGEDATKKASVRNSLVVTNPTPSYGGRDEPNIDEIKRMMKYNASTQNRCVTLKDYQARLNQMPAKYGLPFRFGIVEENNKIVIYTLGLDHEGHLTSFLAETVAENMKTYLSKYKMLNDFIEIRSGKIINLSFYLTIYVDKTYNKSEVTKRVIDTVYDYMDVRRHIMGEDVFIGDMEKEISKLDGVINLVDLRVYNLVGYGYSDDAVTQELKTDSTCENPISYDLTEEEANEIDLGLSDYMLFTEANSMFEIKNKNNNIHVVVKTR